MTTGKEITTFGQTTIQTSFDLDPIISLVLDGLTSEHSKRAYGRALTDFLTWWADQGRPAMSKAVIQRYKTKLQAAGLAPSTINQRLSAIRQLVYEAIDNGLADPNLAAGIARIKGVVSGGQRLGNWLTKEQAQELLDAPNTKTVKGLRDRAILAVLLGAGLRRSECANLTFEHVQQREGRWVIVDLVGKRNTVRSVPLPSWAKAAIDTWAEVACVAKGRIFRRVHKSGLVTGNGISSQAVYDVVKHYANLYGFDLAAHDTRRTFSKLAEKGGADVRQIQKSLGHKSLKTTELYLGTDQDIHDAPCDRLGLKITLK